MPAKFATLSSWLDYLEQLHPKTIDMGLDRVRQVKDTIGLVPGFPVITVGGTNGKGSVCAILESILSCAGYRVGCYTSPHLLRYHERVRIDKKEASDEALCMAFEAIESARKKSKTSLTYFEFGTLAAMLLFIQSGVEVAILEVGLGGRLDAVNVFDPDCAVLTSIEMDHMDYLGNTRESIGFEKIGIFRQNKPAVCAEPDIPATIREEMSAIGAELFCINENFGYQADNIQWHFQGPSGHRSGLPWPALRGACQLQNASACLIALDAIRDKLPVSMNAIRRGLVEVTLPGRLQIIPGAPMTILDVAHNPAAARELAANLCAMATHGRTFAVVAMLKDKDIIATIQALKNEVDHWLVAGLQVARGASIDEILKALGDAGIERQHAVSAFPDVPSAYAYANEHASDNDRICVFGSFHTVGIVLECRGMTNS
jgi:dihydrofolate synthase / folylpolyglutamate synthase